MGHFGSRLDVNTAYDTPAMVRRMLLDTDAGLLICIERDGFDIWDISDPSNLTRVFKIVVATEEYSGQGAILDTANSLLYMFSNGGRFFYCFDYSTPAATVLRDFIETQAQIGSAGYDIALHGDYAYLSGGRLDLAFNNIQIVNVSDPDSLSMEANFLDVVNLGRPRGLAVDPTDTYLLVTNNTTPGGISVFEFDGASLAFSNHDNATTFEALKVTPDGLYAYATKYAAKAIGIFDISDPTAISFVDLISDNTYLNGILWEQIVGGFLYAFNFTGASYYMSVWDIASDPTTPVRLESLDVTADNPWATGHFGGFVVDPYATLYLGRHTTINGNGVAAYGISVKVYPTAAITRVTSIIYRYNRGVFTTEIGLGGVISDFDIPVVDDAPPKSYESSEHHRRLVEQFEDPMRLVPKGGGGVQEVQDLISEIMAGAKRFKTSEELISELSPERLVQGPGRIGMGAGGMAKTPRDLGTERQRMRELRAQGLSREQINRIIAAESR